ncbi:MAG: efflux RND transporter periplasmic adaptor subunit [Candidatus Binataceae bacterium]|jgi:multidrug efflux pump subunit AcrA (membrane-fusion protein)
MKLQILALMLLLLARSTTACTHPAEIAPADTRPIVAVVSPNRGNAIRSITLPGDMVGFYESSLHAKVTGYLQSISVDKGDWVKKGEVLATIEVPELQQRVARAEASLDVQRLTYQRLEQVWKSDPRLIARQDVDIAQGKYLEAKADVDELQALVSYTRIVAPFDGIVTGRFVDPGALIKAGGDQPSSGPDEGSAHPVGTASSVVSLAMIDTMRIYVYVPQGVVSFIKRGTPAMVTLQDLPAHPFPGTVTRFAASLDLSTRTMLTEIDLDNKHHELYPGMYANVTLQLERHPDVIQVPDSAIGQSSTGNYVLAVRDGRLSRREISVGIRAGHLVEVTKGLSGDEQLVAALDPSLTDGESVTPIPGKAASAGNGKAVANSD